jgi:FAD:protein FMN transferase
MKEFVHKCRLMGSHFELGIVHNKKSEAEKLLQLGVQEITRIENLLSEFIETSATNEINTTACQNPVLINNECFELISRSQNISNLTKGCFDITVSPLKSIYSFKNQFFNFPSHNEIIKTLQSVGFQKIVLSKENQSIFFQNDGMKISFSAIGKGYAADKVKQLWINEGVKSGYVNASGDLTTFGSKPDGTQWKIGIRHPENKNEVLMYVPLNESSVATSGDYEQFFLYNDVKYSHNINPITGFPISGIKSVSVFSPSAELSDALATAVYVMGKTKGIKFIDQLPLTHCIIIDDKNKVYFSKKMNYEENSI